MSQLTTPDFPYEFDVLLEIIKRFAYPARQVVEGDRLWRITKGQLVAYHQAEQTIEIQSASTIDETQVLSTSRHLFGFDRDLTEFYQFAKSQPTLWNTIAPLYGLPIFCTETVFEALITLIIEQHIAWKNALLAQRTLMQIFDTAQSNGDVTVYDFPTPEQLANATPEQLKPLKITNRRIDLIIRVAQDVVAGVMDLEAIRDMDTTTAYQTLMQIKGVGHWTAGNVICRAVGHFPTISHNDVALQSAIQHYIYHDEGKKSAQQVIDTLEPYGEYAGLVGHFILLRWVLDRYPIAD